MPKFETVMYDPSGGGGNSRRRSDEDLEKEIEEMMKMASAQNKRDAEVVIPEPEEPEELAKANASEPSDQDHDWKKRHGDARRLAEREKRRADQLEKELQELRNKAEGSAKGIGLSGSASLEEVRAFVKEHSEFAEVMRTFVQQEIADLRQEAQAARTEAQAAQMMRTLSEAFPNVKEIRASEEFEYWLENEARPWAKNSLTQRNVPVEDIKDALASFVAKYPQFGTKTKSTKTTVATDDVSDPKGSGKADAGAGRKKVVYGERMMEDIRRRLGNAAYIDWFERNEAAIDAARRNGTFAYDISMPTE